MTLVTFVWRKKDTLDCDSGSHKLEDNRLILKNLTFSFLIISWWRASDLHFSFYILFE